MEILKQFRNYNIFAKPDGSIWKKNKKGKYVKKKETLRTGPGYYFHHIKWDTGFLNVYSHQIVAECFLGLCPNGYEVDHINSNKLDNRVVNLQYLTKADNVRKGALNRVKK